MTLPGYTPAVREPSKPIFPATAARSVHSPQTIAQSAVDGVAPAAVAKLPEKALRVTDPQVTADGVRVTLRADRAGTAYLYTWDGERALGTRTVELTADGQVTVVVSVTGGTASSLLAAIESGDAARAYQVPLR
ncbi:hypothetical protein [Micromonospora inyonensis]|uniref:Uncharacterized protein n=1 Tax=Micromonospora inyonensis TaxID=47866 RepID=A0A1C6S005_9ACTN|nr:hypothetical protein [Micromonospora inyonensis]SCL22734.1 hypothetical protein GA0074694_3445 [Micromonospora inyonensis]